MARSKASNGSAEQAHLLPGHGADIETGRQEPQQGENEFQHLSSLSGADNKAMRHHGTWDEMWTVLCDDPADYVEKYFSFVSKCIRIICSPWFIVIGASAALYNTAEQLVVAADIKGTLGKWASCAYAASAFALAVAVVLIPRAIRGGVFSGELLENKTDGKSYYEALDVMIKDLVGDVKRAHGSGRPVRSCRSFGVDRRRELQIIINRSKYLRVLTIAMMAVALGIGTWRFYDHVHVQGKHGFYLLTAIPDVMMYFIAFLVICTTLQVLCTAADLHLAQTSTFINWVVRLRTEPARSDDDVKKLQFAVGEAYLLIEKLFMRSSESWSTPLTVWILLAGSLFLFAGIASAFVDPPDQRFCMIVSAVNFFVCMIPIVILVYANGLVDGITRTFLHAKPSDFAAIGGRQEWVDYIKDNPVYWYIIGFPMTRSWLLGFISAAISTAALVIIETVATEGVA